MNMNNSKKKEDVITTAVNLFKTKGYDNISVREICEAANISRSLFYGMFSGKDDILKELLVGVRKNFDKRMPKFITASNDFERIWMLTDAFLDVTEYQDGPQLLQIFFIMDLEQKSSFFNIISDFNEWIVQLIKNCQNQGIIRNTVNPNLLIPLQVDLCIALLFNWVRSGCGFSIRAMMRERIEVFLDVCPEYRWKKD